MALDSAGSGGKYFLASYLLDLDAVDSWVRAGMCITVLE